MSWSGSASYSGPDRRRTRELGRIGDGRVSGSHNCRAVPLEVPSRGVGSADKPEGRVSEVPEGPSAHDSLVIYVPGDPNGACVRSTRARILGHDWFFKFVFSRLESYCVVTLDSFSQEV